MIPLLCPCENKSKELKKILAFFASGQQGFYIVQSMVCKQKCIVNGHNTKYWKEHLKYRLKLMKGKEWLQIDIVILI